MSEEGKCICKHDFSRGRSCRSWTTILQEVVNCCRYTLVSLWHGISVCTKQQFVWASALKHTLRQTVENCMICHTASWHLGPHSWEPRLSFQLILISSLFKQTDVFCLPPPPKYRIFYALCHILPLRRNSFCWYFHIVRLLRVMKLCHSCRINFHKIW
jgi:hypothetical protein